MRPGLNILNSIFFIDKHFLVHVSKVTQLYSLVGVRHGLDNLGLHIVSQVKM